MDLDLFGVFKGKETIDELPKEIEESIRKDKRKVDDELREECSMESEEDKIKKQKKENLVIVPQADVRLIHSDEIETIREDGTRVKSYSVFPADWVATPIVEQAKPAKEYPFTLDPFQTEAIRYIERSESVLVSAHTSAGKTVCAEYAIAKSLRDKQRVIYTSPIKALSNQKYRDLQEEFGDVGLMTGDITINPTATCLIMTTEILRTMLYRGSEIMREVAWVIYDEIHYMRDKSRGVVWEESIILLPHKVRFVFLSATIPNSKEFVGWVAKQHHQPCHVVYTDYRPVPLQHYLYPAGSEGLHLVVDEKGTFLENNFQKAMASLQPEPEVKMKPRGKNFAEGKKDVQGGLKNIITLIMKRQLDPAIIFSFSKKETEANALQMKGLTFNNPMESDLVNQVFSNAILSLSEDDQHLPQVAALLPLLCRGIGIHHGGLLPLLKEVVEILFQEGLIKCLFATETFSIGLNMPARTVVFTSSTKFDGTEFRWITSGEYIQMSGRAGRRGKDVDGKVIQMVDLKMDPDIAKGILYGDADPLQSSYYINYNMLLNMLRVEGADPEYILRSSFHQYQQEQGLPAIEDEIQQLTDEMNEIKIENESELAAFHSAKMQQEKVNQEIRQTIQMPEYCLPYLQPGRIVSLTEEAKTHNRKPYPAFSWGWGVVITCQRSKSKETFSYTDTAPKKEAKYTLDCLVFATKNEQGVWVPSGPNSGELNAAAFSLSDLDWISTIRVNMPKDVRSLESRTVVAKSLKELKRRHSGTVPQMDPIVDLGIKKPAFVKLIEKNASLTERLQSLSLDDKSKSNVAYADYLRKQEIMVKIKALRVAAKDATHVVMRDVLRRMKRVLQRLGHCDSSGIIQLKGRVACEINTCDELVATELIFNGTFTDLSLESTVAVLSCLVNQERGKETDIQNIRKELQGLFRQVQDAARNVGKVAALCNIELNVEDYVNSFTPNVMEVLYCWCAGDKFVDVMKKTDLYEGSVIRIIRRLDELLRQLAVAAHSIGNFELKAKFEGSANRIRRDIPFCGSLYL